MSNRLRVKSINAGIRDVIAKYGGQACAVLDALLTKYADESVLNLNDAIVLRIAPFSGMGTLVQLVRELGGCDGFERAVRQPQSELSTEAS